MGAAQAPRAGFLHVKFQLVPLLEVLEVVEVHAALQPLFHFLDIVLEALERDDPAFVNRCGISGFPEVGLQLWWNTPLNGLRAGIAVSQSYGFSYNFIAPPPFGPGAIRMFLILPPSFIHQWNICGKIGPSSCNMLGMIMKPIVRWLEVRLATGIRPRTPGMLVRLTGSINGLKTGVYYTEYYGNTENRDGSGTAVPSDAYQKDAALSFRFDLKPWWIVKLEGHAINGTGLLRDSSNNPRRNDSEWFVVAVKTTLSF